MDSNKNEKYEITLEYGDIIEIKAPRNSDIHEHTFYITYISESVIKLINVTSLLSYELNITDEGDITDESIELIELLSRGDEKGYARQNGLLPKQWIDVHFGGDFPTIITGEITNLEEDMIELTIYPSLDVIYIDFEYKGLPADVPIREIVIRKKPEQLGPITSLVRLEQGNKEGEEEQSLDQSQSNKEEKEEEKLEPVPDIRAALHSIYIDADDIIFGDEEEEIEQVVEIAEREKRYTIETQVSNMLDELLSTIPNSKRTKSVLDNIHRLITRFKELRQQYSLFDDSGSIRNMKIIGPDHKPLIERICRMDTRLKWILPVVTNKRKIYHPANDGFSLEPKDMISLDYESDLYQESIVQNNYYINHAEQGEVVKYKNMLKRIDPYMTPFESDNLDTNLANGLVVQTNLDSLVYNLENFESSVIKHAELSKQKYVIQRYNLGNTTLEPQMSNTGRRIYVRKNNTPNDTMNLKSLITLPQSVVRYSKVELPSTNIMERASLSSHALLLFRLLNSRSKLSGPDQYIVDQFDTEIDYEKLEENSKQHFLSNIKEYVLDDTLDGEDDKLEKMLKVIIPKSRNLIRLIRPYIQDKMTMVKIIRELEPFMVYSEDIIYQQYMELRFFIKERIQEYKKRIVTRSGEFAAIRNAKYPENLISSNTNKTVNIGKTDKHFFMATGLERIMMNNKALSASFYESYQILNVPPSEMFYSILSKDNGQLLFKLIANLNLNLTIPDSEFMKIMNKPTAAVDMGELEKIKPTDCVRRYIAKRYTKLQDLQKDNHVEIIYDTEFDDTPYNILKLYKEDQKKILAEDFVEFLAENLIQKHDFPRFNELARETAATLIAGKKPVKDGEYAILELRPQLPASIDESSLSPKEKAEIEMEGNSRKITHYYKRIKNTWVKDNVIDEYAFIDNNALFCNMSKICFKNINTTACEDIEQDSELRIKQIAKKKLLAEADTRYTKTIKEMEAANEHDIEYYMKMLLKSRMLREIQLYKSNNYAFELGRLATATEDLIQSPYFKLRDFILSQDDFIKRQFDLCRFAANYCREPMVAELNDDTHWLYCIETNTKLLPISVLQLAQAYTNNTNYQQKQDELCRKQGVLSDDGDSIVDKYSGYIIKKMDLSSDEGYDESGFKITSHEILEKDLKTTIEEALRNRDKVFENETSQTVYNIYNALCTNLGIPSDGLEEFVLRITIELIETQIKCELTYNVFADKMEKQKGKRPVPYQIYRNQTIIMIVGAVMLIGLQTATPAFKPTLTAPGCIRSFSGFPLDGGEEDTTGLVYIACVINKTKSSTEPWNSIQKVPIAIINKGIRDILATMLVPRADINDLYIKKREYVLLHPDEVIPEEHSISKWRQFLPPVVAFTVVKTLHPVSADYKDELLDLMRRGHRDQREHLNVFKTKILQYSYGIFELINGIVAKKDTLLKTASNVPFLQNACCNENNTQKTLDYFTDEDPTIDQYSKIIANLGQVVANADELSRAAVLYHPENTEIRRPPMPAEHFDMNIYAAFIYYCRFDRDIPVPEEFKPICGERPAGYMPHWSLEEKVDFLKKNGKRFTLDQLNQLMNIVNSNNIVNVQSTSPFSKTKALKEILEFLDEKDSLVIHQRLRTNLLNILEEFNPKVLRMEDTEATTKLKNDLGSSIHLMYDSIVDFLNRFGNLSKRDLEHLEIFMENICTWTVDQPKNEPKNDSGLYSIVQFMKNSVASMTKVFPEMILNNVEIDTVHKHWGFSDFHKDDISRIIRKYYTPLNKFKQDGIIATLLREMQIKLIDLNILLQYIPIYTPIHKEEHTFYLMFDKPTIYLLMKYLWLSVIYEYIAITDDVELLHTDIQVKKMDRRKKHRDLGDTMQTINEVDDEDEAEERIDAQEIQITMGNTEDLKRRTAQLLITFLTIDQENKAFVDLTYKDIMAKMHRSKSEEKKMITDFFKNMDSEERKIKNLEKTFKLGRWGEQVGLVKYNKSAYDTERNNIINKLNNVANLDDTGDVPERDIYELEADNAAEVDQEYDLEANDIAHLGDDYMDGNYYGDENDGDFERE